VSVRQHGSADDDNECNGGGHKIERPIRKELTGLSTLAQDLPPVVQDPWALEPFGERGWEPLDDGFAL
jgi:hypothetical protein